MKKRDLLEKLKDLPDDTEVVIGAVFEKQESFEIGQDDSDSSSTTSDDDDEVAEPIDNGDGTMTDFLDIEDVVIIDDVDEDDDGKEIPTKFVSLVVDMTDGEDEDDDEENPEDGNDDD